MAHDREFQRKRKDTRMPVRDSHGEDQPAARQTEQDFDLRSSLKTIERQGRAPKKKQEPPPISFNQH